MKITAELKGELSEWLDTYWKTYLSGDLDTWATFIKDDYYNIGGTKEEIWHSKQEILDYTYAIMDQMQGQAELRNRTVEASAYGDFVMLNEFTDLYVKGGEEWIFYGHFRMSSLMEKTETGWIVQHQHGSYPDTKAVEGEAFGLDAIKAENERLKKSVEERTAELVTKNHELEIETALERVRAVAMGMKSSADMFQVCRVISDELSQFGIQGIRNVQTVIIQEKRKIYDCYQYFPAYQREILEHTEYLKNQVEGALVNRMLEAKDGYFEGNLAGQEFQEFRTHRKEENHLADPLMDGVDEIFYFFYSIGPGALGITLYQELSAAGLVIFKRFHQVFSLAYSRFRDIEKAEAQTREAEIELALERVRARSLAMHQSDELKQVIKIVFDQMIALKIPVQHAGFIIDYKLNEDMHIWLADHQQGVPSEITIPYFDSPHWNSFREAKEKGASFFANLLPFEVKNKFYQDLFQLIPSLTKEAQDVILSKPALVISTVLLDHVGLYIENYTDTPFSEQENGILIRFCKVFEQAYTRFLDLQKAEIQTRESQINLAVERVRAQSMAMHHPDDLDKVNKEILSQLNWLQIQGLTGVTFYLIDENGWVKAWDFSSPGNIRDQSSYTLQFDSNRHEMLGFPFKTLRETDLDYFVADYPLEKLEKAVYEFEEIDPAIAKIVREALSTGILTHQWTACCRISNGLLGIDLVIPPSEDTKIIILKMAGAFNQAYIRFLDLQKAEAQAREAQIEAALERIRSRSLAMHQTSELQTVIHTVHQELKHLDVAIQGGSFITINADLDSELLCWGAGGTADTSAEVQVPHFGMSFCTNLLSGIKKGPGFFTEEFSQKEKKEYFTRLFGIKPWSELGLAEKQTTLSSEGGYTRSVVVSKHTSIFIINQQGRTFTAAENDILKRFGKVFEQAYTRFLDLQKAEEQAREAKIELALEKIRVQSMAMMKSEDLTLVVSTVFKELGKLDVNTLRCGIGIIKEENRSVKAWITTATNVGDTMEVSGDEPLSGHPLLDTIFINWKTQKSFGYTLEGNDLIEYYKVVGDTDFQGDFAKEVLSDGALKHFYYCVMFPSGGLFTFSDTFFSEDTRHILKRFADAFFHAYKRFEDLQKAEAQAREAQIEAALERVRSRTMGMHTSEEMKDLVSLVIKQLIGLGFKLDLANFNYHGSPKEWLLWMATPDFTYPELLRIPAIRHPLFERPLEAYKQGQDFMSDILTAEEFKSAYAHFYESSKLNQWDDPQRKRYVADGIGMARSVVFMKSITLTISNFQAIPYSEEQNQILKRFANAFEQAYIRFLDIQKAEAQAREAQIQLALERVRARTMAMQHSDELGEASALLFKQVSDLGIQTWTSGFNIWEKGDTSFIGYNPTPTGGIAGSYHIPSTEDPFFINIYEAKKREEDFFVFESAGESLANTYHYMKTLPIIKDVLKGIEDSGFPMPTCQINHCAFFTHGFLLFITLEPYPNAHDIFKRIGKVFEQTYTRFLDLQKAEAQSRESQIELGLERVRARAMGMQNSNELAELVDTVFKELTKLDFALSWCMINIIDEPSLSNTVWGANPEIGKAPESYHMLFEDYRFHHEMMQEWKARNPKWVFVLKETEKEIYDEYLFNQTEFRRVPEAVQIQMRSTKQYVGSFTFSNFGGLQTISEEVLSDSSLEILNRFGKVFDLTYTRFNDLQKAEAQAKEATIEMSLERVRSKTMAMQRSEQLPETAEVLFQQFALLGGIPDRIGIGIVQEDTEGIEWWITDQLGSRVTRKFFTSSKQQTIAKMFEAWQHKKESLIVDLTGSDLDEWIRFVKDDVKMPLDASHMKGRRVQHAGFFSQGLLLCSANDLLPQATFSLLIRFAKVFEQTYTRFLDLQKAEAQAREAKIEAALEKIRSRTMAMQHSDELQNAAILLFQQVQSLGIKTGSCGFFIWMEDKKTAMVWNSSQEGGLQIPFKLPHTEIPHYKRVYEAAKKGDEFHVEEVTGEALEKQFNYLRKLDGIKEIIKKYEDAGFALPSLIIYHEVFFKQGYLSFHTHEPAVDAHDIFKRFGKVFEQTYTRFLDLQKAEAQAREAQIEVALERVRSRSMAMHKSDELKEAGELLWNELGKLGIPSLSSGYVLMDKEEKIGWIYAPNPATGKIAEPIGVLHTETKEMLAVLSGWKKQDPLCIIEMNEEETILHQTFIAERSRHLDGTILRWITAEQLIELSPKRLFLHNFNFKEGYLLIVGGNRLTGEQVELLIRFTKVFQQTYTRFLDLQKAEAQALKAEQDLIAIKEAKQKAEDALTELQAAQKQLIQSEKMASLGELTAGIAHEIQNPLNFVNNFSEVSSELITEMVEEVNKGNYEEVKAIADDVKQNLDKINHHGKRAGDIVKGMLQHSRSSSDVKEPTDINALCDEFLRLAYHGLRAKDKSFNANFETDFDKKIGKISVVPQDMGRVIMNLITNAFYAVNERKHQQTEGYEPKVSISTKKEGNQIFISVKDNGNGIPASVKDKIFQPFFTTKPTGQGTGLGLSLSYDIIKAHGGEIRVETKEMEETTFIISLPTNNN